MATVGIMSMQRIANYGSFLQAYALKTMIEELGHSVQFVDYRVCSPVIQDVTESSNKLTRMVKKGLETFAFQAPLQHKLAFIKFKKNYAGKYLPLLGITDDCNYSPKLDCMVRLVVTRYLIVYRRIRTSVSHPSYSVLIAMRIKLLRMPHLSVIPHLPNSSNMAKIAR